MSLQQFSADLHDQNLSLAEKHASFQTFITYFDTVKLNAKL